MFNIILKNKEEKITRKENFLTRNEAWDTLWSLFTEEIEDRFYLLSHNEEGEWIYKKSPIFSSEQSEQYFARYYKKGRGVNFFQHNSKAKPFVFTIKKYTSARMYQRGDEDSWSLYEIVEV